MIRTIRNMSGYLKKTSLKRIYLGTFIRNYEARYVQFRFYLYKGEYTLKIHINELN